MHKDHPKPEFIVSEAIERNEASIRRIHDRIEQLQSTIDRIRGSHPRTPAGVETTSKESLTARRPRPH